MADFPECLLFNICSSEFWQWAPVYHIYHHYNQTVFFPFTTNPRLNTKIPFDQLFIYLELYNVLVLPGPMCKPAGLPATLRVQPVHCLGKLYPTHTLRPHGLLMADWFTAHVRQIRIGGTKHGLVLASLDQQCRLCEQRVAASPGATDQRPSVPD